MVVAHPIWLPAQGVNYHTNCMKRRARISEVRDVFVATRSNSVLDSVRRCHNVFEGEEKEKTSLQCFLLFYLELLKSCLENHPAAAELMGTLNNGSMLRGAVVKMHACNCMF